MFKNNEELTGSLLNIKKDRGLFKGILEKWAS